VRVPARALALWADELIGVIDYPEMEIVRARDILPDSGQVEGMVATPQGIVFIENLEILCSPLSALPQHD
jgi:hypothetical protein